MKKKREGYFECGRCGVVEYTKATPILHRIGGISFMKWEGEFVECAR